MRDGGLNKEGGRQCARVLPVGQCCGSLAFSSVDLFRGTYEMHLRTIFLQNERGKHLFPLLPNPSGRGSPAGICAPTFWGCTWVNPRLVLQVPHAARQGSSTLQPWMGLPSCLVVSLVAAVVARVRLDWEIWERQEGSRYSPPCTITRSRVL